MNISTIRRLNGAKLTIKDLILISGVLNNDRVRALNSNLRNDLNLLNITLNSNKLSILNRHLRLKLSDLIARTDYLVNTSALLLELSIYRF